MEEAYIGDIVLFAGNFAPSNWMLCNGQLLPVSQYSALYSLIGITYGGDGRTTFALPDLRSRMPLGAGQSGSVAFEPGQLGGVEKNEPTVQAVAAATGGATDAGSKTLKVAAPRPYENTSPHLALNYIICVEGRYPSGGESLASKTIVVEYDESTDYDE